MRKKAHKKVNPQNRLYDQFYLVNYLEFGKNWEDISRERTEDELPTGFDAEKEEDADWSDWRGTLVLHAIRWSAITCSCLDYSDFSARNFCAVTFGSVTKNAEQQRRLL
jgi:hypothetical protein